jgi:diguanylate cyclase
VETSRATVQQLRDHLGALQNEALTDPLTSLLNRRGLEREFARRFEASPEGFERCGVLIADIDHFKRVNDNYGHSFGDQVIRAAAQSISQVVKGRDLIARWGGEEFLILLPETPRTGAMALAEQVRAAFAKVRIRRAGSEEYLEKLTLSLGVAMPLQGESLDKAIARADSALYKAKYAGRNRVSMAEVEPLGANRQNVTR